MEMIYRDSPGLLAEFNHAELHGGVGGLGASSTSTCDVTALTRYNFWKKATACLQPATPWG